MEDKHQSAGKLGGSLGLRKKFVQGLGRVAGSQRGQCSWSRERREEIAGGGDWWTGSIIQ